MGSQVYLQIYNGNESAKHGSFLIGNESEEWDLKSGPKEPTGNINTKNIFENGTHENEELKTFENNNMLNYLSDESRLINNNILTPKKNDTVTSNIDNNNINNNNNNNINSSYKVDDNSFVDNGNGDEKEIDTTNLCVYDTRGKEIYSKPKLNISLLDSEISTEMYGEKFSNGQYLGEKSITKHSKHVSQEKGEGDKQKREKQKRHEKNQASKYIDVRKIETSMPEIDLEVIESHLKAAKEEEKRRRNEREEIRRRLASGCDTEEISTNRFMKKPSLQTRLQNGMNLQICFMNEASSDTESPSCDSPCKVQSPPKSIANPVPQAPKACEISKTVTMRENEKSHLFKPCIDTSDAKGDFFVKQTQLQAEARLALSQAKEKARFQMEADRLSGKDSPVTEILRLSLKKVGFPFSEERRRVSRQLLTDMNVAQLQVIVNDLHSQIEYLNESLVTLLMERDELHMTQDSMLVDIEDVTRYLGAKEDCLPEKINVSSAKENVQAPSFW